MTAEPTTVALEPAIVPAVPPVEGGFGADLAAFFDNPQQDAPAAPAPDTKTAAAAEPAAPKTEKPAAKEEKPAADGEKADPLASFDEVDDTKGWTAQAARRFKEVKAEAKAQAARAEELAAAVAAKEARLAELEALAGDDSVKTLQARLAEYEDRMLLANLESTHAYNALVKAPMAEIVKTVDEVALRHNLDADALLDVVALEDAAAQEERLTELLAGVTERDRYKIFKAAEDLKPVLAQKAALHANRKEALAEAEALEATRKQTELAERARQRKDAATAVVGKLESKLPFLATFDGVDMKSIAAAAAATDPTALDHVTGTYQAIAAQLLPKLAANYVKLQAELGELTDKLAEYDNATPKAGGGGHSASKAGGPLDNTTFADAIERALSGG